jgi:hypothetical protein
MTTSGYTVVDALPPPARCSLDAAHAVTAKASFTKRTDGEREVALHVDAAPRGVRYDSGPFNVTGGRSPASSSVSPTGALELRTIVENTNPVAYFTVPITCGTEPGELEIMVDWDKQGTAPDIPLTVDVQARAIGGFH